MRYRFVSPAGVALTAIITVWIATQAVARWGFAPPRVDPWILAVSVVVFVSALWPLYTPRPWRPLDRTKLIAKRVVAAVGLLGLAGYLGIAFVPTPEALVLSGGEMALVLFAWFGLLRRLGSDRRTVVVGDDPGLIEDAIRSLSVRPIGFVSPVLTGRAIAEHFGGEVDREREVEVLESDAPDADERDEASILSDGGEGAARIDSIAGIDRIGGLSRIERGLCEADAERVALAFRHADREEFFGILRICRGLGVDVLVHESLADSVLVRDDSDGSLIELELEALPWYKRGVKRAFDVAFSAIGLVVLSPLVVLIAVAIKLDSPGPVFYGQPRTSELGNTFRVLKFRSMAADAESGNGATLSRGDAGGVDPRVTRVGRILRETHLDEMPQLVSVLLGDMSVVGPRPERPELEFDINRQGVDWEKRWLLKPGLTGLAQVNGATGFEPAEKLSYDLEYARRQSLWLDVKLIALQIWMVFEDVADLVSTRLDYRRTETLEDSK